MSKITYNRITWNLTNFHSQTTKKNLSWEKAVKMVSNYLRRISGCVSDLELDKGEIWSVLQRKSINTIYSSEMWLERKPKFTQEELEKFKTDVTKFIN